MEISLALLICVILLFSLVMIGTPVGYSIMMAAVGYLFLADGDLSLMSEQILQGLYNSFVLLAVPLFIVAANIMNTGTMSERLLDFCIMLVGRLRGGLGHVNVLASLVFSGMSGSAVADAAGIGKIIINMMTKENRYSRGYAAAITAASATIGPIIPPSIPMVLYSLVSDASIGALFLGGVIPGFIMASMIMIMNAYLAKKRGFASEVRVPVKQIPRKFASAFPVLLTPIILLYGIYGGVATPTESAAIAAFYALILTGVFYRSLSFKSLYRVFVDSAQSSASVGLVIGGAFILNYIVISENIPQAIAEMFKSFEVHPMIFLVSVNILVLFLGCILDATTIILVIIPLFIPVCKLLGIDLVYFGVLVVVNSMIGLITPPYGILLFVLNAVTGIPLKEIIREIWAFLLVLIFGLISMILFPDLILWLPRVFGYQSP